MLHVASVSPPPAEACDERLARALRQLQLECAPMGEQQAPQTQEEVCIAGRGLDALPTALCELTRLRSLNVGYNRLWTLEAEVRAPALHSPVSAGGPAAASGPGACQLAAACPAASVFTRGLICPPARR